MGCWMNLRLLRSRERDWSTWAVVGRGGRGASSMAAVAVAFLGLLTCGQRGVSHLPLQAPFSPLIGLLTRCQDWASSSTCIQTSWGSTSGRLWQTHKCSIGSHKTCGTHILSRSPRPRPLQRGQKLHTRRSGKNCKERAKSSHSGRIRAFNLAQVTAANSALQHTKAQLFRTICDMTSCI